MVSAAILCFSFPPLPIGVHIRFWVYRYLHTTWHATSTNSSVTNPLSSVVLIPSGTCPRKHHPTSISDVGSLLALCSYQSLRGSWLTISLLIVLMVSRGCLLAALVVTGFVADSRGFPAFPIILHFIDSNERPSIHGQFFLIYFIIRLSVNV